MKKAVILARVSTEEQKKAGNSLLAQTERLKRYCNRKNFEIKKIFNFDESAYKTKRDNFDKILAYIKKCEEQIAVCFDKVDRFSRNVFDKRVSTLYKLAMKDEIELHFASDNIVINSDISATEKFHFSMNLGLANYYSNAIGDSVKRANEAKIAKGEWGYQAPVGYINTEDNNGNKTIKINSSKSHFIKKIFEFYSIGSKSMRTLAEKMKRLGLRSKKGKPLSTSSINRILKNPFYYGEMKIKDKLYSYKYKTIISKTLFEKCQSVMLKYHKKPSKYASKPFTLRGMIRCAKCGCMVTPEEHKGHVYYSCTNYKKEHEKRRYIREEKLLEPILEILKKISLPKEKINIIVEDLKKSHEAKNNFHKKALINLRKEHDKIENKINRLFDLRIEDSSITKDMFQSKLKELKEEQVEINREIERHDGADESYYITANKVLELAKNAYKIFESSKVSKKQQLLNFLLQNCKLEGEKLQFKLKTPFDTVLEANNCTEMGG
jgi:DNA invertase Pin-like site-specific DNA recombinase